MLKTEWNIGTMEKELFEPQDQVDCDKEASSNSFVSE